MTDGALRPFAGPMGLAVPAGRDNFRGNSTCPNSLNRELVRPGGRYSIDAGRGAELTVAQLVSNTTIGGNSLSATLASRADIVGLNEGPRWSTCRITPWGIAMWRKR